MGSRVQVGVEGFEVSGFRVDLGFCSGIFLSFFLASFLAFFPFFPATIADGTKQRTNMCTQYFEHPHPEATTLANLTWCN